MSNTPTVAVPSTTACGAPRYRDPALSRPTALCETRADGTLLLRSADAPLSVAEVGFSGFVAHWAATRAAQTAFGERSGPTEWRTLCWSGFHRHMLSVAAGLLELGLSQSRPLMILSGNSIEQALLVVAAEYVGIPTAPVSPAYSLQSTSFARLHGIHQLVEPAAVFVQSALPFAKALQAVGMSDDAVIVVNGATPGQIEWRTWIDAPLTPTRLAAVAAARASIAPKDVARIFFTSGSTGTPKGVPLTYDNVSAMIGQIRYAHLPSQGEPVVMLDWLPCADHRHGAGRQRRPAASAPRPCAHAGRLLLHRRWPPAAGAVRTHRAEPARDLAHAVRQCAGRMGAAGRRAGA